MDGQGVVGQRTAYVRSDKAMYAKWSGPDWMRADQVIQKLLQSGYTMISKIEADDGRWEGNGIKNGLKMEFHADAKSGVVTFEKLDD